MTSETIWQHRPLEPFCAVEGGTIPDGVYRQRDGDAPDGVAWAFEVRTYPDSPPGDQYVGQVSPRRPRGWHTVAIVRGGALFLVLRPRLAARRATFEGIMRHLATCDGQDALRARYREEDTR